MATLRALAGEFGWRNALATCATILIALAVGGVMARVAGIA